MMNPFFAIWGASSAHPDRKKTFVLFHPQTNLQPVRSVANKSAALGWAQRVRIRRTEYKRKHKYA